MDESDILIDTWPGVDSWYKAIVLQTKKDGNIEWHLLLNNNQNHAAILKEYLD